MQRARAQASVGEIVTTAESRLRTRPGFGVSTRFRAVPFQCSASVRRRPQVPMAQASVAELADTSTSDPCTGALGTGCHAVVHDAARAGADHRSAAARAATRAIPMRRYDIDLLRRSPPPVR